jgi:hypothetical protein
MSAQRRTYLAGVGEKRHPIRPPCRLSAVISVNFVYLGSALGALGTSFYIRDTLRGTTQPNRVTWLLWAVAPLLAAAVEFNEGVGLRTLTTFMVGFMPLLVLAASFYNPAAVWKIGPLDYMCGALSIAGTIAWLVTRSGVIAIVAAIAADALAGLPTLLKSWTNPETETVWSYVGAVTSAGILLLTVNHWTTNVVAFPLLIVCIASVQVVFIGARPGPRWQAARTRRLAA